MVDAYEKWLLTAPYLIDIGEWSENEYSVNAQGELNETIRNRIRNKKWQVEDSC